MQSTFRARILLSLLALALATTPAYSTAITTYSSLSSWQAAVSGTTTIDFESTSTGTYSSLLNNGVQFIGYTGTASSETIFDTSLFSWSNYNTGHALDVQLQSTTSMPYIHIVLPAYVTAASVNLFTTGPPALSFTVTLAGMSFTAPTFTTPTPAFFGVTSDTPFNTIDLSLAAWNTNQWAFEYVDNVSFGTAVVSGGSTDTPEAATFLMIGSGLIGLIGLKRRLARSKTASPLTA